jgi:hypothetical protein
MDFTKFVSLLSNRMLFFVRAKELKDDPYEGAFPPQHVHPAYPLITDYIADTMHHTDIIAVSCWHVNEYESAAMWKLYLKSNEGIAIQSTFKRLAEAFSENPREIYIGKVNYIDYGTDTVGVKFDNMLTYLLHKRRSFEYERELRALTTIPPSVSSYPDWLTEEEKRQLIESTPNIYEGEELLESGVYTPVNLDVMIENIYVPPKSETWFSNLVKVVMGKFGLEKEVVRSDLDRTPL